MTTLAGNVSGAGTALNVGHADGAGTATSFSFPFAVAMVSSGAVAFVVRQLGVFEL